MSISVNRLNMTFGKIIQNRNAVALVDKRSNSMGTNVTGSTSNQNMARKCIGAKIHKNLKITLAEYSMQTLS